VTFEVTKPIHITIKSPQSEKYYSVTQKYRKIATPKSKKKWLRQLMLP